MFIYYLIRLYQDLYTNQCLIYSGVPILLQFRPFKGILGYKNKLIILYLPILVRLYLRYSLVTLLYFYLLLLTILLLSFLIGVLSGLLKAVLSFYFIYLVTIELGLYKSVKSVNQPLIAFGCPATYIIYVVYKNNTSHCFLIQN